MSSKKQRIRQLIYLAKSQEVLGAARTARLTEINETYNLPADNNRLLEIALHSGQGGLDYWV